MKYTESAGADVSSGYRHGVLQEAGNNKYAKFENKTGIKLVAIKVVNNTTRTLNGRKDLLFFAGDAPAMPAETKKVKWNLQQGVGIYVLYLLLTPLTLNVANSNGSSESYPIGYALGPGITLINVATAGTANAKFARDIETYSLDRDILPGQGRFFLVGFEGISFAPITVKVRE